MNASDIEDIYELSPVQQGMLYHALLSPPEAGVYFFQTAYVFRERMNVAAFEQTWRHLVARYPVFRTAFFWKDTDKPLQVVYRRADIHIEQLDWRGMPAPDQQAQLERWLEADRRRGFDLSHAPILRLTVIRCADDVYHFVWSSHYLLLDGWSVALVTQEMIEAYYKLAQGDVPASAPAPSMRDYILWLQRQDMSRAEAFWRQQLAGVTAPTPLVVERRCDETHQQPERYAEVQARLPSGTTAALRNLARQHQVTLNTIVQGAWALLLSRYSGERDVIFGAVVSGRPPELPEVERIVGAFINTLPVRVEVSPHARLGEWLRALQARIVAMRDYEYSPLVSIQGWSDIPRGQPLFESIVIFENYPVTPELEQVGHRVQQTHSLDITGYPLTFSVVPGRELLLVLGYDCRRFEEAAMQRMLGHVQTLLEGMIAAPDAPLVALPLLTADEERQLAVWNSTQVTYSQTGYVHDMFAAQAQQTPDALAVIFEDRSLTYRDLDQRTNQLAHYLREFDIGPESLVGVCIERSIEMVIALMGTLKAGAAYVPIDPTYPSERVAFMLEDSQTPVLLTQQRLLERLSGYHGRIICLDSEWDAIAQNDVTFPGVDLADDNLAYMIYTSGSTGKPKGAMNTHGGLRNRLLWMQSAYGLNPTDCVMQKTPCSFDVSVWEFFWPLMTGARLVVARPEGHKDSAYLVRLIIEQSVTTLHFVPSMLQAFVEERDLEACVSLRRVICSGETLPLDLQQRFLSRLPHVELHNLYGPTEAAIDVTYWACQRDSRESVVPIGYPIANTQIHLLDAHMSPVPVGIPGELYIGGVNLARGYWRRPDLTADRFIPNPFAIKADDEGDRAPSRPCSASSRLYKTGDLARYRPDGSIEYLGRLDHQIKLRGFRIELGEIETVLRQHPAVREGVVIVREDQPGNRQLVAYLAPARSSLDLADVREHLKRRLPEYMIPSAFVVMEALPLTPNGKIDRKALPAPERTGTADEASAPRTVVEQALAAIWQDMLGVGRVGVHDNFFTLGGNSLLILQMIARARRAGLHLSPRHVLEHQTIAELAPVVAAEAHQMAARQILSRPNQSQSNLALLQAGGNEAPLFFVHPSSGDVLCFIALARHLGQDRPFYGLESPDLYTDAPPMTDIETMATRYLEAVRQAQPRGPYYLGGWSGGGNIAFEMAQQLVRQGEEVAFLGMVDSLPRVDMLSAAAMMLEADKRLARFYRLGGKRWKKTLHRIWGAVWSALGDRVAEQTQRIQQTAILLMFVRFFEQTQWGVELDLSVQELMNLPLEHQFERVLEQMKLAGIETPEDDLTIIRRRVRVTLANSEAIDRYEPQTYPGHLTYFRARDSSPNDIIDAANFFDGPAQGWERYVRQPPAVHLVPGHHNALMEEPYVQALAEAMRMCLERVSHAPAHRMLVRSPAAGEDAVIG